MTAVLRGVSTYPASFEKNANLLASVAFFGKGKSSPAGDTF
jgi:hypothetical protein